MRFRRREFPYPVLAYYNDDYPNARFEVDVEAKNQGVELYLTFNAKLASEDLMELIRKGYAEFSYHIECSRTGYRKVAQTGKTYLRVVLDLRDITGVVEILPVITSKKDLKGYASQEFHSDYEGLHFDIEPGSILAVADPIKISIDKSNQDLGDNESIFSFISNKDLSVRQMIVDYQSEDKILIILPEDVFGSYKILSKNQSNLAVLNSLTIIPALIYVLTSLEAEKDRDEDMSDYEGKRWYRQLRKILKEQFKIDINGDDFYSENKVVLAQKLCQNPLIDAVNTLYQDTTPEDEE